jgi:hypothetical protein
MNSVLISEILESLIIGVDGEMNWGDNTERLIEEFARQHDAAQLALAIRNNVPINCDLDRLGFFIGILLNGFPGIDDSYLTSQLREWVNSPVEAEFRCAISELHVLYHCDHSTESIMATFGNAMEERWPAYRGRIVRMRELWLSDVERVRQEKHARRTSESP